MENRISALENRQAGLRERVARIEAGQISSLAILNQHDQRLGEQARRMDAISGHLTTVRHTADTRLLQIETSLADMATRARNSKELRRWLMTAAIPTIGGIIILVLTGNIDLALKFASAGK